MRGFGFACLKNQLIESSLADPGWKSFAKRDDKRIYMFIKQFKVWGFRAAARRGAADRELRVIRRVTNLLFMAAEFL